MTMKMSRLLTSQFRMDANAENIGSIFPTRTQARLGKDFSCVASLMRQKSKRYVEMIIFASQREKLGVQSQASNSSAASQYIHALCSQLDP